MTLAEYLAANFGVEIKPCETLIAAALKSRYESAIAQLELTAFESKVTPVGNESFTLCVTREISNDELVTALSCYYAEEGIRVIVLKKYSLQLVRGDDDQLVGCITLTNVSDLTKIGGEGFIRITTMDF